MEIIPIDAQGRLFISPAIDEWKGLEELGITAVIDLDGDIDTGIPTAVNHLVYIYFPICDGDTLPDLHKLYAIAQLGARLVQSGHKVLSHCGLGYNRSALVAGLILIHMGMSGEEAVTLIREKRPGALWNETFAQEILKDRDGAAHEVSGLHEPRTK
jgi:protein-tyrosine phosphatase